MPSEQSKRAYLPGLTGLRGVGAAWVLCYHVQYALHVPVAECGFLAVDLFFMLSGFVLSHAHSGMGFGWASYTHFLRDRFARIFPMHWAALTVVGLVLLLHPTLFRDMEARFGVPELIASVFLVQNWGFSPPSWNGPAWSLSTEWLVSLGFPLFLWGARRVERPLLAGLGCAACLGAFALVLQFTHHPNADVQGRAAIVRTVLEFAAGCLLYRMYLTEIRVNAAGKILAAALLAVGLSAPDRTMFAIFAFPIVILISTQRSMTARVLASRPLAFLGRISFSIYLLHWILLQASDRLEASLGVRGWGAFLWFCGFTLLVLVLSTVTYHLVENPARLWIRGGFRLTRRAKPVPA